MTGPEQAQGTRPGAQPLPPLDGVSVLDVTSYVPGPACTASLAHLGASVTRILRPGIGDPVRHLAPGAHAILNRGKAIAELDLRSDPDRRRFRDLVEGADVVVTSLRRATLSRLDIVPDRLLTWNQQLISCAIDVAGPDNDAFGHDLDVAARTGVLWFSGEADAPPHALGVVPSVGLMTGAYATQAVLAALFQRARTGHGTHIDVSMVGASLKLVEPRLADHHAWGRPPRKRILRRGAYGVFTAADGKQLILSGVSDKEWRTFCDVLHFPELRDDVRFRTWEQRCDHADAVDARLAKRFATRPAQEWLALLERAGVAASPLNGPEDLKADPVIGSMDLMRQARADGMPLAAYPARGVTTVDSDPIAGPRAQAKRSHT